MKLIRVSVFFIIVGLLIVGASATAMAAPTQSWVTDPATGCKIGYVHETSTLISARWSGPIVAGKAQGKGNLSLTVKGKDGKELQGQGQAEMRAGLLNGKAAITWSDGSSYDGYYKAGLREGKCILKYANGDSYDGYYKADLKEGKGIYKQANGYSYDGEWKNGKMEGHGVLKDAAGKITYEGEYKDGKPVTQPAQPKTAPTQQWVADPATSCKIGWVSANFTLISARWSGPIVAGKAQGKGNLSLTVKDKDGKELQYQGQATMLAGLLDGKVALKWSDGDSYDGYYKAGFREGKGIFKFADGSMYDGEWKNDNREGTGTYKWPNGNVYTGAFKNGVREGHGVFKDASGKIIYEGEYKDDKPVTHSAQPKTDNVLGIPWGASEGEAKRIMLQRPNTVYFSANSDANTRWHTYMGGFNDYGAKIQVHFYQGKMYGVGVFLPSSEDQLLDKFNSVKQGLTQRYGPPLMDKGKYLDSVAGWDLGGDYIVIIEIRKNTDTVFIEPFAVMISYQNQATQNEIGKGKTPTSGNDY